MEDGQQTLCAPIAAVLIDACRACQIHGGVSPVYKPLVACQTPLPMLPAYGRVHTHCSCNPATAWSSGASYELMRWE